MEDTYRTIEKISRGLYRDKGSRFISYAIPVTHENEIREHLLRLKKEYHDAHHHCYAWILGSKGENYRYHDDGEPSGTAGRPIYGILQRYDLTNTLIVVIRYFGGIKLGTRGLIDAYRAAAEDAIRNNTITEKIIREIYEITFSYEDLNTIMRIVKEEGAEIVLQDLTMPCRMRISIRKSRGQQFLSRFKDLHRIEIHHGGDV